MVTYCPVSLLMLPPSSTGISRWSPAPCPPTVTVEPGNLAVALSSMPEASTESCQRIYSCSSGVIVYTPSSPALFVLPLASCVFRSRSACFAILIGSCWLDMVVALLFMSGYGLEVRDSFLLHEPRMELLCRWCSV